MAHPSLLKVIFLLRLLELAAYRWDVAKKNKNKIKIEGRWKEYIFLYLDEVAIKYFPEPWAWALPSEAQNYDVCAINNPK